MNKIKKVVVALLLAVGFGSVVGSEAQAKPRTFADRPLDTSKRLYVRKSGTRVLSDPAPPRRRVWRYRRADGRIVTKVTGDGRAKRKPVRRAKRRVTRRVSRRSR